MLEKLTFQLENVKLDDGLADVSTLPVCFRAVIGEIDEETDSTLDLGNIRAEPLNSVVH